MRLRALTMDDSAQVLEWRNSSHVADFMFNSELIEPATHALWMARVLESPTHRYWVIEHNGTDFGVANLADIDTTNQRCAWAFYLGNQAAPGPIAVAVELEIMGIVFGEMKLEKLISEVLDFNTRVIDMHERAGFVREGVLREHIRRSDGVHDVVVLSMLRPEWQARHESRWRRSEQQ